MTTGFDGFAATRRAVLGGLAAGAGAMVCGGARASRSETDILIVGAGAAAIGAASALRGRGLNYMIVEADTRIGGRALTDTKTFLNSDGAAIPFDIGCAWIHNGQDDNPLKVWAKRLNYDIREHDLGVKALFYGPNRSADAAINIVEADERGLAHAMEEAAQSKVDVAADRLVADWHIPMDAAATEMGPMDAAVDICAMSTLEHARLAEYDPNFLVKRGYGALVGAVADALGVPQATVTGTAVTRIRHDGGSVLVDMEGARPGTIAAKAVIVTTSVGVLKSGAIAFVPGLPASYQDALDNIQMGLLAKIPLLVPGVSHETNGIRPYDNVLELLPRSDLAQQCGQKDIYFLAWPWNTDLMVGFVGGALAWDLSLQKDAQRMAVDFATQRLGDIFGSDMTQKVSKGLLTPWATNKLTYGAYSAATPGHFAAREVLAGPIEERLYFAGEAVAPGGMFATCSGAYASGANVAGMAADTLQKKSRA
jgi:monoamine oxidase